jgi:hypothetical protein
MIRVGFCDVRPKSQQTSRLMNLLVSQLLNRLNPANKDTGRTQRAGPSLVAASWQPRRWFEGSELLGLFGVTILEKQNLMRKRSTGPKRKDIDKVPEHGKGARP